MKKLIAITVTLLMILATATMAEMNIPFSEWIEAFGASAEQAVVQDEPLVAEGVPLVPFVPIGVGSRGDDVVQLQEKLIELGFLAGKADGIFGAGTEAALKAVQKALGWEETGVVETREDLGTILTVVPGDGINLAVGTSDDWSEWMAPKYNEKNQCFIVSTAYLGEKQIGDPYTCQLEIEFSDVTAMENLEQPFRFYTQGQADGNWEDWIEKNAWNFALINLYSAPENGVVRCVSSQQTTEQGVEAQRWDLGFRCDYWATGKFRVRCVKIEKGAISTNWSQSPKDIGDGVNLAVGTSDDWSEWMAPKYNEKNQCFIVSTAYLGEKQIGDPYTCQLEIEFSDVTAMENLEQPFRFYTQGQADGNWEDWIEKMHGILH